MRCYICILQRTQKSTISGSYTFFFSEEWHLKQEKTFIEYYHSIRVRGLTYSNHVFTMSNIPGAITKRNVIVICLLFKDNSKLSSDWITLTS